MSALVRHQLLGPTLVLQLHGEFDLEAHPTLLATSDAAAAHREGALVIDLTRVEFLSCSAARVLATMAFRHTASTPFGCTVVTTGFIRRMLRLTGFFSDDDVTDTVGEAVRRSSPPAAATVSQLRAY